MAEGREGRFREDRVGPPQPKAGVDRGLNQPGGVGPASGTNKPGTTVPTGASDKVGPPAGGPVQDDAGFRSLPRSVQRQIEAGTLSLADAMAGTPANQLNSEGGGGGGVGPPSPEGGGGGGGGGVPGAKGGLAAAESAMGGVEGLIKAQFEGILSGKYGSFTQEKENTLKAELQNKVRGSATNLKRQADADAIRRGILRSDIAAKKYRDIDTSMEQELSRGINQIKLARIDAEFADKMKALDLAQNWLNGKRQYEIGKEQIAAQREATAAQTALGYAQIAAQKEIAGQQAGVARAGIRLGERQFEFSQKMALADLEIRHVQVAASIAGGLS